MRFHARSLWFFAATWFVWTGLISAESLAGEIAWRAQLDSALREAEQTNKPVLVTVFSPGCGWCRELERTTFHDARVIDEINRALVPVRIDASDPANESILRALWVEGVPVLAVVGRNGQVLARRDGYLDSRGFRQWLRSVGGLGL